MTVNDARLFSMESRLTEEEEMRVKEYEYVRDMIKKLLYTLEQLNMTNIEAKKNSLVFNRDGAQSDSTGTLPNLLNPS